MTQFETEDNVLSHVSDAAQVDAAPGAGLMAKSSLEMAQKTLNCILTTLDEEKAEEVLAIDLAGKSELADHIVVASGRSSRQVSAISDKIVEQLKSELGVFCKVEGKSTGDWVLIDAGDVIVHVFRPEVRAFYQLEKMWAGSATDVARG